MSPAPDLAALIGDLRTALGHRRIRDGISTLENARPILEALDPAARNAGVLLGLASQWVDAGFASAELISRLLSRFPRHSRSSLPLIDYLHLRMAEGLVLMADEDFEGAAQHFRFVQSVEDEIHDVELVAIANFWTGRCLRRMGQYDDALTYIARAEECALSCGYRQMAAIMQATLSWIAFQRGKLSEAVALLRRAEEALCGTDDYLSRGNIQSAYGRIARRQGRYARALEHFERAIGEYRAGGGGQLQLARCLLNMAFVERLLALEAQKELDRVSSSRTRPEGEAVPTRERRLEMEQLRASARARLDESASIYRRNHNHRGIAGVHINRGFLSLDAGDLDCAGAEAAEAFHHGDEKHDAIVLARARTLQCMIEIAAIEEEVGEAATHREAAETFAREAVQFAAQTQNRRLLAKAYVWQGLTFASPPDPDLDGARRSCEDAEMLLQPEHGERQYVWEDFELLKTRVVRSKPIDATLRAWSAGIVEARSFQQMTEEFARIVIPKVWEREGRKVSRVAAKLAISPKKVRRILISQGLLPRAPNGRDGKS